MTQIEYAEKILKIYPRVLMEIERDRGNPTLETLVKIARPFGLKVGFVVKRSQLPGAGNGEG
jgi:DNA-binding XRE family transcriptional regulator